MTNYVSDSKLPATTWMQNIIEWCGKFDNHLSERFSWLKHTAVYAAFDDLVDNQSDYGHLVEVHRAMIEVEIWLNSHPIDLLAFCVQTHLRSLLYISTTMREEVGMLPRKGSKSEKEIVDGLLMKLYFEQSLHRFVAWAAEPSYNVQEQSSKELWITMIFRAMCWYNLHGIDNTDKPVDPKHFDSQHPIYIG